MKNIIPLDLRHYPIFLSPQEIGNPFQFINQFYSQETDLLYARKELKLWFRSALSDNCLLSKSEMVSLIGFKDFLVRLIEAGHLIQEGNWKESSQITINREETQDLIDPLLFHDPKDEITRAWYYFPRHLSRKEFTNPCKALQRMFEFKPLYKWRKIIDELLAAAISNCDAKSCVEEGEDIYKVFECMFKLLEATHLIYVRLRNSKAEQIFTKVDP